MADVTCEKEQFLSWLGGLLRGTGDVRVDVEVVEESDAGSSVYIILRDVPGSLAGLEIRMTHDRRSSVEENG